MPTSHTITTIYNRALDYISEFPVHGPEDTGSYARWLNRNYAHTVEAALRQQPWNFACRFWLPVEDAVKPSMRWNYGFELPNGWLRVLTPTRDGLRTGYPMAYGVQGNTLMMNERPTKGVELVMNIQNPGQWDPLFADMVAGRLAAGMAQRYTAKNSYLDRAKQAAEEAYAQAELINSFEGSLPENEEHDILRARGSETDGWRNDRW